MRPTLDTKQKSRFPRALSGLGVSLGLSLGLSLGVSLGAAALMVTTGFSAVAETVKPPPAAAAAHVEGPLLTGFWQAFNDDGRPGGVFYFYEKNGLYEGRLVKAVTYPDEPPDDPLCKACTGEKKNQPMMGLVIVYGMKRHGAAKYEDGHILDPRDGKIWSAELDVTPDNKKLNLRGYIGTPLLGQTRVWTRLPDDTMAAADIPGEPIAALAGVQGKKPASAAAPAAAKPAAPKAQ
jgi:hypothetical protein